MYKDSNIGELKMVRCERTLQTSAPFFSRLENSIPPALFTLSPLHTWLITIFQTHLAVPACDIGRRRQEIKKEADKSRALIYPLL
jgi:hypothetical protein